MVVEGSWIISLSLIFIMGMLLLSYEVFGESMNYVDAANEAIEEFDVVQTFKSIQFGKEIYEIAVD